MLARGRRTAATAGLVVVAALLATPVAFGAGSPTPPANTPNMSLMVLQPADLQPGANLSAQRYIRPPKGFSAAYATVFTNATTASGGKLDSVESDVALAPSTTSPSNLEAVNQLVFSTRRGRKGFVKDFIKSAGKKARLKAKNFKFSPVTTASVGSQSFVDTVTISHKGSTVQEVFVFFADGDAYSATVLVGSTVAQSDAVALAQLVDGHIHSVLGGGATGASGAT
jgi:hypothetical protein